MYNKNCFCITNEQHFSISVPLSDPISGRISSAQVLFLVSIVMSLALFFFLNEGIRHTHLHGKFFGIAPAASYDGAPLLACRILRAFFSVFFVLPLRTAAEQTAVNTCLRRPFPTVCLIFMIITMALAAGRDCRQAAAFTVGDTTHIHTQSSISRQIDAVCCTEC